MVVSQEYSENVEVAVGEREVKSSDATKQCGVAKFGEEILQHNNFELFVMHDVNLNL